MNFDEALEFIRANLHLTTEELFDIIFRIEKEDVNPPPIPSAIDEAVQELDRLAQVAPEHRNTIQEIAKLLRNEG